MICENTCCGDTGLLRSTMTSLAGDTPGSMHRKPYSFPFTRPISAVCTPAFVSALV
jgi:hypothetical protein